VQLLGGTLHAGQPGHFGKHTQLAEGDVHCSVKAYVKAKYI
jgi:hypothetical protein